MKRSIYYSRNCYDVKVVVSHEPESLGLIIDFVEKEKPKMIVELGTAYYGLTLLLHECNIKTPLFTFDKFDARIYLGKTKGLTTKKELEHVFKSGFNSFVTFVIGDVIWRKNLFLIALLKTPKRKLLYCDNGKKERELSYYATELLSGDILGVHDWGTEVRPDKVKNILKDFEPCAINKTFEEKKLLTRFFIKK